MHACICPVHVFLLYIFFTFYYCQVCLNDIQVKDVDTPTLLLCVSVCVCVGVCVCVCGVLLGVTVCIAFINGQSLISATGLFFTHECMFEL